MAPRKCTRLCILWSVWNSHMPLGQCQRMTLSPPDLVSSQYWPWCCGFWWVTRVLLLLLTTYFSPILTIKPSVDESEFLGYHWSSCLGQGVMISSGRRRCPILQHLLPSLVAELRDFDPSQWKFPGLCKGLASTECTWELSWVSHWGLGQPPITWALWNMIFSLAFSPSTHNPFLTGSSLQ